MSFQFLRKVGFLRLCLVGWKMKERNRNGKETKREKND